MIRNLLGCLLVVGLIAIPGAADFIVSAPDLTAYRGDDVNTPFSLYYNEGTFLAVDVEVTFDTDVLSLTGDDITLGSLFGPSWVFTKNTIYIDSGIVYLGIFDSSGIGLENPDGNLFNCVFHVRSAAPLGVTEIGIIDYNDYGYTCDNGSIDVVPEPAAWVMLASLIASAALLLRRRS